MSKYTLQKIADELDATASGSAYYGNAVYTALDLSLPADQQAVLHRWLNGSQTTDDEFRLQEIAINLRVRGES